MEQKPTRVQVSFLRTGFLFTNASLYLFFDAGIILQKTKTTLYYALFSAPRSSERVIYETDNNSQRTDVSPQVYNVAHNLIYENIYTTWKKFVFRKVFRYKFL